MATHGNFVRAFQQFGPKETLRRLIQLKTLKFGTCVGTDRHGTEYYENREYPHGQHRWFVRPGWVTNYSVDPSIVPAEWHPWLHHVTDDPPTSSTTGSTHKDKPQKTVSHSDAVFERNLGGVVVEHTPNYSLYRPRGYGVGNGLYSEPHEEKFYTQPGHALDKRQPSSRAEKLPFTLKDTSADVKKRVGFYANTNALLEAGENAASTADAGNTTAASAQPLQGAVAEAKERSLLLKLVRLDTMIKEYGALDMSEVEDAMGEVAAQRAEVAAELEVLRAAKA